MASISRLKVTQRNRANYERKKKIRVILDMVVENVGRVMASCDKL